MDLLQHLKRQIAFSRATFGPGERRAGVADHIRNELETEILREGITPREAAKEWVDVVALGLDGLTRALIAAKTDRRAVPAVACAMIEAKQSENEGRDWPDWRGADPEKRIEHIGARPRVVDHAAPVEVTAGRSGVVHVAGVVDPETRKALAEAARKCGATLGAPVFVDPLDGGGDREVPRPPRCDTCKGHGSYLKPRLFRAPRLVLCRACLGAGRCLT